MKTVNQLIVDQSFINWVFKKDSDDVIKWEKIVEGESVDRIVVEEAYSIVRGIDFTHNSSSEEEKKDSWSELNERIQRENFSKFRNEKHSGRYQFLRFAAAVAVLVVVGYVSYTSFLKKEYFIFETTFNQKATLELPDGSKVTLNSNSKLRYPKTWHNTNDRMVWLNGEAYFEVSSKENGDSGYQKFIVHTDELLISVVGTSFNVNTHESDYVVLEEGIVKLNKTEDADTISILLKPGEMGWFNGAGLSSRSANVFQYIAWKDNKVVFDNTSITEIVSLLEHNYGLEVSLKDETLASRKLSGELSVSNADDLLFAMEKSFNLKVTRNKNDVIIDSN